MLVWFVVEVWFDRCRDDVTSTPECTAGGRYEVAKRVFMPNAHVIHAAIEDMIRGVRSLDTPIDLSYAPTAVNI